MEAWPREQRKGWEDTSETLPDQELTSALQTLAIRRNRTWPGSGDENQSERRGRNPPTGTQSIWGATMWPPAGPDGRGQRQEPEVAGIEPPGLSFVQTTSDAPQNQCPTEEARGPGEGGRGFGPEVLPSHPSKAPIGTPRGLLAPIPQYREGTREQAQTQNTEGTRGMQ